MFNFNDIKNRRSTKRMRYSFLFSVFIFFISCKKENKISYVNQKDIPLAEYNELIALCDTVSLKTYEDFDTRIARIQEIFSLHNDKRGAFPTVYKAITNTAVISLAHQDYQDNAYTLKFSIEFSKRYLYYLKHHLLNEPLEYHWDLYYNHAMNNTTITRLVLEGINAHVTIDMTRALAQTGAYRNYQSDWLLFGDKTVASVPDFLIELKEEYHTDASGIFNVFFIGDIVDSVFGAGATINFGFNVLRMDAFNNALFMIQSTNDQQIETNLKKSFYDRETIFDALDKMKLTP